jgi:glucan 1,3-beta-glucosidase
VAAQGRASAQSLSLTAASPTPRQVRYGTQHNITPPTAGSLILENVQLNNVPIAVQGPGSTIYLAGSSGSMNIAALGQGHSYTPTGPVNFMGPISPFPRPGSLLEDGGKFYERSKPQYATVPESQFSSVRDGGAKEDGVTDDAAALTQVIAQAAKSGKIVFFDAGTYKIMSTLYMPSGSKIVGEGYSNIIGSGGFFSDISKPRPVTRVGTTHERGSIEWSDMIVSTQGATAGVILVEFNLASSSSAPSGIWDVHARVGGFAGSSKYSYSI